MSNIVGGVTSIVSGSAVWLGDMVTAVTKPANSLLLFFCICGFVGIGIGLLKRFVNR